MPRRQENTEGVPYVLEQFSAKETAAAMRSALTAEFPGVKFSVRMARGTAWGWVDVAWTDGPTPDAVTAVTDRFQSSRFDGSDDGYHRIEPTMYVREDGVIYEPTYSCVGVNTSRGLSVAATDWAETVATPGSRWWVDAEAYGADVAYYATRRLLSVTDLTVIPAAGADPHGGSR